MAGNQYYSTNDETGRDGYLSEFDAQRAALARRRRLAQMLQQQSMERSQNIVNPATGGRTSWLAPIAQMAQAYMGKRAGDAADAEGRTNAAAEQTALEQALANAPQGTPAIPAQEMGPPTPDTQRMPMLPQPPANFGPAPGGAPTLGQQMTQPAAPMSGMLPQLPAQMPAAPATPPSEPAGLERIPGEMSQQPEQPAQPPSPNDLLGYASKLARFGNPVANKVAERASGRAIDSMFPQLPSEEFKLRQQELALTRAGQAQSRAEAAAERERSNRVREAEAEATRAYRDAQSGQANDLKWAVLDAKRDSAAREARLIPTQDSSMDGHPIYRNGAAEQFEVRDGKPVPYSGETIPRASLEKEVPIVRDMDVSITASKRLGKMIEDNKEAFGPLAGLISGVPLASGTLRARKYTPDELVAQASVSRDAAMIINKLYGAALSAREDERAKSFTTSVNDPPALLQAKLRAALAWAEEKRNQQSEAARRTAARRAGSPTEQPPGGAGAPAGWGKTSKE